MHPRLCVNCNQPIPIDYGFYFDQDLNLIHEECDGVVFATNPLGEAEISKSIADKKIFRHQVQAGGFFKEVQ